MKAMVPWFIAFGCVGMVAGVLIRDNRAPAVAVPGTVPIAQIGSASIPPDSTLSPGTGTVVHTFTDEAEMQTFTAMWQERQVSLLRTTVLEGYWNSEQTVLAQLTGQLDTEYSMNAAKQYVLDGEARVLRERPASPEAGEDGETDPEEAPEPMEGPVVHTFADDEAMGLFTGIWRRQQAINLRMTLLQSYWNQEQVKLAQVNEQLKADYTMDTDRNYFLDGQRRVLLEQPAPPAPAAQPTATP